MKQGFESAEALLAHAAGLGLRTELLAQLRKDFERARVPFPMRDRPPEESSDTAWAQALHESIYLLLMERFDSYLNLMYAADVPERQFRDLSLTDAVDVARQVTRVLLLREWQKVWMRRSPGDGPST